MIAIGSREAVIQDLEDVGCGPEMIQDFLGWFDKGQQKKQLELLEHQREHLLGRVHKEEKRISCLDHLKLENMGVFTAYDKQNRSEEKLEELKAFGKSLV